MVSRGKFKGRGRRYCWEMCLTIIIQDLWPGIKKKYVFLWNPRLYRRQIGLSLISNSPTQSVSPNAGKEEEEEDEERGEDNWWLSILLIPQKTWILYESPTLFTGGGAAVYGAFLLIIIVEYQMSWAGEILMYSTKGTWIVVDLGRKNVI